MKNKFTSYIPLPLNAQAFIDLVEKEEQEYREQKIIKRFKELYKEAKNDKRKM